MISIGWGGKAPATFSEEGRISAPLTLMDEGLMV